jgi:hypothetical protein
MEVRPEFEDPRFAAALKRKEEIVRKVQLARAELDKTLAHVSATNMHDKVGWSRDRPLEHVKAGSVFRPQHGKTSIAERMKDRRTGVMDGSVGVAHVTGELGEGTSHGELDPMVQAQREEWKRGVATLKSRGLEPPRDFEGERIGEPTSEVPAAAAAEESGRLETEEERKERQALAKARRTVMRNMGIPDKSGPKLSEGPHLIDHVKQLRQFSSTSSDAFVSETKSQYGADGEFQEELQRNARRTKNKLKKNAFSEYTEAVAYYSKMMGAKSK